MSERHLSLLSCVLVDSSSQSDALLETFVRLAGGPGHRLHWRHERPARRLAICREIGGSGVASTTWVMQLPSSRYQERARRLLLEAALFALAGASVEDVIIESRHAERDGKDRQVIAAFGRQGVTSAAMTIRHGRPTEEPLQWLPDAVAGAVGDHRCGQPEPLAGLGSLARRGGRGPMSCSRATGRAPAVPQEVPAWQPPARGGPATMRLIEGRVNCLVPGGLKDRSGCFSC